MSSAHDNPLSEEQREKSGSDTLDRFDFQYHWALCQAFNSYSLSNDFAVFLEYHEDVVFASSTNKDTVQFSFNQVKANVSKKYTLNELTKRDKEKVVSQSLLGKLCSSVSEKKYSSKVSDISFISTSGFSLKLKEKLKLKKIKLSDLDDVEKENLLSCLDEEVKNFSAFPIDSLSFEESSVPLNDYVQHTVYTINKVVNDSYPNHFLSAMDIYRILMDSLKIRGKNTFDYTAWNQALSEKALTYNDIQKVVTKNISEKSVSKQVEYAQDISRFIECNPIKAIRINKRIETYRLLITNPSILVMGLRKEIKKIIHNTINCKDPVFEMEQVMLIKEKIPSEYNDFFDDELAFVGAIIYELSEEIQ